MSDNFQQTVNLKDKAKKTSQFRPVREQKPAPPKPKRQALLDKGSYPTGRAEEIDQVYNSGWEDKITGEDLRKINRPKVQQINEPIFKRVIVILAFILVGLTVYWLFFRGGTGDERMAGTIEGPGWYAVKLVTEEIYYGQIEDIAANPLVLTGVYYDYDQIKEGEEKSETSNLRLVKRGKETHGPSGTMYIYQDQVSIIDLLREDSKVLKAILDYER